MCFRVLEIHHRSITFGNQYAFSGNGPAGGGGATVRTPVNCDSYYAKCSLSCKTVTISDYISPHFALFRNSVLKFLINNKRIATVCDEEG
jgi:hypothetical protein